MLSLLLEKHFFLTTCTCTNACTKYMYKRSGGRFVSYMCTCTCAWCIYLSSSVWVCWFPFPHSDEELDKFINDEDAVVMIDKFISQLDVVITCTYMYISKLETGCNCTVLLEDSSSLAWITSYSNVSIPPIHVLVSSSGNGIRRFDTCIGIETLK